MSSPLIQIRGLAFPPAEGRAPGVSLPRLELSPGRVYALIGGSGCGKSLLLSLLATFPPPSWENPALRGNAEFCFRWFGEEITPEKFSSARSYSEAMKIALERAGGNLCYLPQTLPSHGNGTAEQILSEIVFASSAGKTRKEILSEAERFFAEHESFLDWKNKRGKRVDSFSGGERKRFEICARLIALRFLSNADWKTLFLLDEPTAGLDCVRALAFFKFIRDCAAQNGNIAFVVATHDLDALDGNADGVVAMQRDDKDDENTPNVDEANTCCEIFCGNAADFRECFDRGNADSIADIFKTMRERGESAGQLQAKWLAWRNGGVRRTAQI